MTPDVAGAHDIFTRLQHDLRQARGQWVTLSTAVQDKLSACHQLVQNLSNRPTNLRKLDPFNPTWEGTTDASSTGMGGVYQ